ncbi:TPA_asm: G [Howea betacytorhabdovirus 1]|nr:TPA_asm: G [Howea betacytorhabdovirus 1]
MATNTLISFSILFEILHCVTCSTPAQVNIPPLLVCKDNRLQSSQVIPNCPTICSYNWDLSNPTPIELFNQVKKEVIPVKECSAYMDVVKTTESYLFSKSWEIISTERIMPKKEKCLSLIKDNCQFSTCKYHESLPDPNYLWGSETITTYERYSLETVPEVMVLYEGTHPSILVGSSRVSLDSEVLELSLVKKILFWGNQNPVLKECPLNGGKSVVSYKDLSTPGRYWIPDLGMEISSTGQAFKDPRCTSSGVMEAKNLRLTDEGLIYAELKSDTGINSFSTIIVSSTLKENERLILRLINDMERNKAKESCLSRCYQVDKPGMHMLGNGGIFTFNDGKSVECSHFVSPTIPLSTLICKNPIGLLRLHANHQFYWWNPESPILESSTRCNILMKQYPRTPLSIGPAEINSSGLYLHRIEISKQLTSDAFSQTHLSSYLSDQSSIKLDNSYEFGSEKHAVSRHVSTISEEHDSWVGDILTSVGGKIKACWEVVEGVGDEIRIIFITIIVGMTIIICWKLIPRGLLGSNKRNYHQVSRDNEVEMGQMSENHNAGRSYHHI